MKWAKVKKTGESPSADQLESFEYYDQKKLNETFGLVGATPDDSGKIPKQSPNLWARYKYKKPLKIGTTDTQRDYEIFCGGFLHFYDLEVRNNATKHIIYFDWSKKIKGFYYVSIFIFPKPYPGQNIPQVLQKETSNVVGGKSSIAALKTTAAAVGSQDSWAQEYAAIDPPPPPPPPPPTRE